LSYGCENPSRYFTHILRVRSHDRAMKPPMHTDKHLFLLNLSSDHTTADLLPLARPRVMPRRTKASRVSRVRETHRVASIRHVARSCGGSVREMVDLTRRVVETVARGLALPNYVFIFGSCP